jgi:hypothetical protein
MAAKLSQLNLRPGERRLVVGIGLLVFLVLNMFLVWPHFGDWQEIRTELGGARTKLQRYQNEIAEIPRLEARIRLLESADEPVPEEDQGTEFLSTIQRQASLSGVTITGSSRMTTRTNNPFFIERSQTISVLAEERALLDFLYRIGSAGSMTRIRGLSLRPDAPRQRLTGNITLVASYQKKPLTASTAVPAAAPARPGPGRSATTPAPAPRTSPASSATNAPASAVPVPSRPAPKPTPSS